MTFFYKNAINIFTDASTTNMDGKEISNSGFIAVYNGNIINKDYKIFYDSTNTYGELYAINMGVEYALNIGRETDLFLNIISDSLISIKTIKKWIFEWKYSEKNPHILLNKQNCSATNQDLILNIISMILYSGIHINFYHILGHKRPNNVSDILEVKLKFKKNNNLDIAFPDDIIQEMISYNNEVDKYTRSWLHTIIKNNEFNHEDYQKFVFPCMWKPNPYDMKIYKELIS